MPKYSLRLFIIIIVLFKIHIKKLFKKNQLLSGGYSATLTINFDKSLICIKGIKLVPYP
jgi:hypothetical protein